MRDGRIFCDHTVIMNELVTHGALPWHPRDRARMILVLRFMPQYQGSDNFPEAIRNRLTAPTRELIARAGYADVKEIVAADAIKVA